MLQTVVIVVHLLVALGLVGLVLVQQGKGADAGASFGSGASATVFGSQGSATFLSRVTGILAAVFFATSLGLAFFAKEQADELSQVGLPDPAVMELPADDGSPEIGDVPVIEGQGPSSQSDIPVKPESE
ncbi:preprotein translocase subunit SecG [Stutzerimonas urumqiensis]|uniref:preprotein translocase subunit SecG n=1 Tax=Stutzerimonas urumqiensis TaxID=638269 RepID=UPI003BAC22D2